MRLLTILRRLSILFYAGLGLAALAAAAGGVLLFVFIKDLPRIPEPLSRIIDTPATEIFAATGERIMVLGGREAVPLSRVSPYFIQAILATEDHRFWEHHGVDKLRTLKALWVTLFKPGTVQGASTITQQLAKNLFFSFKRSYKRKLQELLVSLQIEARYSKAEILQAYVNQIPFGVGAHGIENAARRIFGKTAFELTLAEASLLAGLPKSPTRYNPYHHPDRARQRQKVVLNRMVAVNAVTSAAAAAAFDQPLHFNPRAEAARTGSYFLDAVIQRLERRYGPDVVYHGGLQVTTTLVPQWQAWAAAALKNGLERLDALMGLPPETEKMDQDKGQRAPRPQGALVSIDVNTGAVKAVIGGRNYAESEFNRALHNHRQPGSGFKPFLYYTAFEKLDLNPASLLVDRPVVVPVPGAPDWQPRNFSRKHAGPVILKHAFVESVNTIAAQLVKETGPAAVIDTAKRCGINSPLQPVYSVALGTSGVSPLEMASSFATFAGGGVFHKPFLIWRVEDPYGHVLEETIVRGEKRLDPARTYQVLDMMQAVVDTGTGSVIRQRGFNLPAAGKTGTTDLYHDAWFTGVTPTIATAVWVGFDKGQSLRDRHGVGISGGRGAAPIWADFMINATAGEPVRKFSIPPGIGFQYVDSRTGQNATVFTRDRVRVALAR